LDRRLAPVPQPRKWEQNRGHDDRADPRPQERRSRENGARNLPETAKEDGQPASPGCGGDGRRGAGALRVRHFGVDAADSWPWLRLIFLSLARFFTQVL